MSTYFDTTELTVVAGEVALADDINNIVSATEAAFDAIDTDLAIVTTEPFKSNINTVADISSDITTAVTAPLPANIATVITAPLPTNIATVAGIAGNVTTVAGNSANVTTVATNPVKANLASVVTNLSTINDVATAIDSGTLSLATITATTALVSDTISERTPTAGVTIDGTLIKDGVVTADLVGNVATATELTNGTGTINLDDSGYGTVYKSAVDGSAGYSHVWENASGTQEMFLTTTGFLATTGGFSGSLFGNASTATLALDASGKTNSMSNPGGNMTSGTVRWAQVGKVVTISWENLAHPSLNVAYTAAIIPVALRPSTTFGTVYYFSDSAVYRVVVIPGGNLQFSYRNWAGAAIILAGTSFGTISYAIN